MASPYFTNLELLKATSQVNPLLFQKDALVTLSDITLSDDTSYDPLKVIQELGNIFKKYRACLSNIPEKSIRVKKINPLQIEVLDSFLLRSANHDNWLFPPFNRFAYRQISSILDVETISRGVKEVNALTASQSTLKAEQIEAVRYISNDGLERSFREMLTYTHTDSIVILHDGKLVYENYFDGQSPLTPHIQFSVTKSLIGLIVTQLIIEETIDPKATVAEYIPEIQGSAFADATILDLLDMTTGMKFVEEYDNRNCDMWRHFIAASYLGRPPGYTGETTSRSFLATLKKEGEHRRAFHYVSANSELLAWLVEKATEKAGCKKTVNDLFTSKIWSKLGTESDAYIAKDRAGDALWSGGFTATVRDMARIGQLILNNGEVNGNALISPKVFEFMRNRDMRPQFPPSGLEEIFPGLKGWSYSNQFWWTHNEHDAFTGIGINGQLLYIDPKARVVIAKNSSHPEAVGQWLDWDAFKACHEVCKRFVS